MRIQVGVGVMVATALAVGGCGTSPQEGASDASRTPESPMASTAASPAESASMAPAVALEWESALQLEDGNVTALADTPAGTFVVAGAPRARQCDPTPMWSGDPGSELTPVDVDTVLGDGASVMRVVAGGPGAVAVGCLPEPDRLVVWTSADGSTWSLSETGYLLPAGGTDYMLDSVAAGPDRAILAGIEYTGIEQFVEPIEQAATDAMPASLRPFAKANILVEPQRAAMNIGPFSVWSASLADLGVDPAVGAGYEKAISGTANPPVTITTDDYVSWTTRKEPPIPDVQAASIVATSDGFLASAFDFTGETPTIYASVDGRSWEQVAFPVETGWVDPPSAFTNRAVLGSMSREDGVGLWETADLGATWTELSPVPAGYWGSPTLGGLGYLIASTVGDPENGPIEFSIERGDRTLTISMGMDGGSLRVVDGGRTRVDDVLAGHWRSVTVPPSVRFDNKAGEMIVVDPESGEALMALPYADVDAAFADAVIASGVGGSRAAFSADGLAWSDGPLPGRADRFGGAWPVAVGANAVWVAVNHDFGGAELFRGTPSRNSTS
jgi:hypothetical protein